VEAKCAESFTQAMYAFSELEKFRYLTIVAILEQACHIESRLHSRMEVELSLVETTLEQIDAPRDIRSTFAKLKAMGEKKRPGGRGRRKNSIVNRTLMSLANIEDDEEDAEEVDKL
jgi:hypothetical protein